MTSNDRRSEDPHPDTLSDRQIEIGEGREAEIHEQVGKLKDTMNLIVRGDDFGSCHSVNLAIEKCFEEGIMTCTSLMVPTPWFSEAAEICRAHPEWCIGIHLALTCEWEGYLWGPVLPKASVPGLVDEAGWFYPRAQDLWAAHPTVDEIEGELRAQVELAMTEGIKVSYLDLHMLIDHSSPRCGEIVRKVARDYDLFYWEIPIDAEKGWVRHEEIYWVPPERKKGALMDILRNLEPGVTAFICHPGMNTPEMQALKLRDPGLGPPDTAAHRGAITAALIDPEVRSIIAERGIRMISISDREVLGESPPT